MKSLSRERGQKAGTWIRTNVPKPFMFIIRNLVGAGDHAVSTVRGFSRGLIGESNEEVHSKSA